MNEVPNNYYAYLVRFRRSGSPLCWRISLLDIHGGNSLHFNDLATFFDFVQSHFAEQEGLFETNIISQQRKNDEHI